MRPTERAKKAAERDKKTGERIVFFFNFVPENQSFVQKTRRFVK